MLKLVWLVLCHCTTSCAFCAFIHTFGGRCKSSTWSHRPQALSVLVAFTPARFVSRDGFHIGRSTKSRLHPHSDLDNTACEVQCYVFFMLAWHVRQVQALQILCWFLVLCAILLCLYLNVTKPVFWVDMAFDERAWGRNEDFVDLLVGVAYLHVFLGGLLLGVNFTTLQKPCRNYPRLASLAGLSALLSCIRRSYGNATTSWSSCANARHMFCFTGTRFIGCPSLFASFAQHLQYKAYHSLRGHFSSSLWATFLLVSTCTTDP